MRSTALVLLIQAMMALAAPAAGQAPPSSAQPDVFAYVRALDEAGARHVWPGFDPSAWPIALFDGTRTILLRHPSPPPEFTPMPDRPGVLVLSGRYPAMVGNSTREIGGVRTATVLATPGLNVESTLLACVEEVFHVFWLTRHPAFRPNEMTRYAYPLKDADNLRRMLAEDEALARALEARADEESAAWAAAALRLRRERTAALDGNTVTFETALEMMEGTANYTARRSLGQGPPATAAWLRTDRRADAVRWRFYDSGTALGFLLDRFDPAWKVRSDQEPGLTMVELLAAALAGRSAEPREFSDEEIAGFRTTASREIADLADRQQRLRREVLARPGARVILDVGGGADPFRVERFDPINLFVLDDGEVVQANFITLAGASGSVAMTNLGFSRNSFAGTVALTVAAGRHPLAGGIRRITIVGLAEAPRLERGEGTTTVTAPGLRIELRGAQVRSDGDVLHITVPRPSAG